MKQTMFDVKDGVAKPEVEGLDYRERKIKTKNDDELRRRTMLRAVCPWCLHTGTLDKFTRFTKEGEVAKLTECPECGQAMKDSTLNMVDMGPEKYSEWFWTQVTAFKARDRVKWETVKKRVKEMGFSTQFWDAYKRVKEQHDSTKR